MPVAARAARATYPKASRLLRRGEYLRVQNGGRRVHTAHFVILLLPNDGLSTRLGVTVGKRVGAAVQRNRIKRVLREVFRREKALFPSDCDVVLVARTGAERLDYGTVKDEVVKAQASMLRVSAEARSAAPPPSDSHKHEQRLQPTAAGPRPPHRKPRSRPASRADR